MKKSSLLLPLLLLSALFLFGFQLHQSFQTSPTTSTPFTQKGNSQWYKMNASERLTVSDFLQEQHKNLGLHDNEEWVNYRTESDDLGFTHHRFQLHHNGIPVEGAELLIHEKDGRVSHFNGCWTPYMEANTNVILTGEEAMAQALNFVPSDRYVWDDEGAEQLIKQAHNDPHATAYPQPELILYNKTFPKTTGSFHTAYKMTISAYAPLTRRFVVIDAQTGELLESLELLHHVNTPGVAHTRYHGEQTIITDSLAPNIFRLYENTRGIGVHTMNLKTNENFGQAVEFLDNNNDWNNVNAAQDEVGTDAHFSAEMTYDFFHEHLGHSSVAGNDGIQMISLVHYGTNINNAFWNGSWITLGDGDGSTTPLTSLDVVGHEFAHGVTDFTADLIYQDEPGGLNESFSDIFGTAIEFWGQGGVGDYLIGEDFHTNGNIFRDMSNPNVENHPDTYLGTFWEAGTVDNGGVHTNSGVQNYWFYLLTEGGSGTNDNGLAYEVEGVGMDTSTMIAFRNLKHYLTRFSQYEDARVGALTAAEDLYGPCSFAAIQTAAAWRAVGLGTVSDESDFELIQILDMDEFNCGLTDQVFPTIELRYNDCINSLAPNTPIPIEIVVDNGVIQRDTILLANTIAGADTILHTIDTPISGLETMGLHTMTISLAFPTDSSYSNSSATFILENVLDQNTDFAGKEAQSNEPACFMTDAFVSVEATFLGCDQINSGAELFFSYNFGGTVVTESTTLNSSYDRGETLTYTFDTPLDATDFLGITEVEAWVSHPDDAIIINDSVSTTISNPEYRVINHLLTYETEGTVLDSFYTITGEYSDAYISSFASFQSDFGIYMTGKNPNPLVDNGSFDVPTSPSDVWQENDELSAMMCICVDTRPLTAAELSFDKRQVYSNFLNDEFGNNSNLTSPLRVLIDGEQVSPTYLSEAPLGPWSRETIDISDHVGDLLEVCFETRCASSVLFSAPGDRVYLDNILISGVSGTNNFYNNGLTLSVFPNPGNGDFIVRYESNKAVEMNVEVYDVYGRMLLSKSVDGSNGTGSVLLNMQDYAKGIYFVKMDNGAGFVSETIVLE